MRKTQTLTQCDVPYSLLVLLQCAPDPNTEQYAAPLLVLLLVCLLTSQNVRNMSTLTQNNVSCSFLVLLLYECPHDSECAPEPNAEQCDTLASCAACGCGCVVISHAAAYASCRASALPGACISATARLVRQNMFCSKAVSCSRRHSMTYITQKHNH